tara:strand:+ start:355 stop:528 length:174 start_codon:yes stop_codon:yes gene_type:complete
MASSVEHKDLNTHVELCAERYRSLEARILRLERVVLWATAASLSGMAAVILALVTRL